MAVSWAVSHLLGAVSWCMGAVSQTPPIAIQNCIVMPKPMSCALRAVSRVHAAVSQRYHSLYRNPKGRPHVTMQKLYRDPEPMSRALRAMSRPPTPYCRAMGAMSRHKGHLSAMIQNFCIARLPRGQAAARALLLAPRAGRPCRRASWPYRGAMS